MKIKLTTLLFGLLLAVGWTSSASAQALAEARADKYMVCLDGGVPHQHNMDMTEPGAMLQKIESTNSSSTRFYAPPRAMREMVTLTESEASALKYSYRDINGVLHENVSSTEVATDPCQMYSLLRFIYKTKAFPGPYTSAYTADGVEEREVYYGGIAGGWNIAGQTTTSTVTEMPDINIVASNYYVYYRSITVYDENNNVITSWDYNGTYHNTQSSSGTTFVAYDFPSGWSDPDGWIFERVSYGGYYYGHLTSGSNANTITISHVLLEGHSSVKVEITAFNYSGRPTVTVNGTSWTVNTNYYTGTTQTFTINANTVTVTSQVSDIYKPTKEGYTALVVAVKNNASQVPEAYNDYDPVNRMSVFNDSAEVVNYFKNNVDYIKLLTDGLRITDASGNPGTVFNCDGTYNKFFFLGKGQARQKDPEVIRLERTYGLMGERVPFKEMFEEFSPTGGQAGDQITDFYDKMREGNVYDVVHDCAAVIDNGHQFSMSGNTGTTSYPLTGLNFFIPDYRLMYWTTQDQWGLGHTVDGRTMNPYKDVNGDMFHKVPSYCSNYAQYNPQYAPKVGIYKITLSATATFVGDAVNPDHSDNNLNFVVTLVWNSSLNDMAGHEVPQTYTIYCFDNVTGERFQLEATGVTNPTGQTTVSYLVPQRAHSYTIEYIIQGTPNDSDHPSFVAWSNRDFVVIPGWDDFVGLKLDHHESDFATNEMANYYRNFLAVINEDLFGGLTVDKIVGKKNDQGEWVEKPMNEFTLYRFLYKENENHELVPVNDGTPIAKLKFGEPDDDGNVPYTVTYVNPNDQKKLETPKYDLDENHLNIPLTGVVRIKGNGDIVIWPNTYQVNFKSIKVYNGTTLVASWDVETMTSLPSGWKLSPGSEWEEHNHNGDQVGYIEGGGYIYIPGIVTEENSENLRVEIVAYGDLGTVARIIVNDHTKTLKNGAANVDTYIWGGTGENATPVSPFAAPRRNNTNNNSNN